MGINALKTRPASIQNILNDLSSIRKKGNRTTLSILNNLPLLEKLLKKPEMNILAVDFTISDDNYLLGARDALVERLSPEFALTVIVNPNMDFGNNANLVLGKSDATIILSSFNLRTDKHVENLRNILGKIHEESKLPTHIGNFDFILVTYPFWPIALSIEVLRQNHNHVKKILRTIFKFQERELGFIQNPETLAKFLDRAFLEGLLKNAVPKLLAENGYLLLSSPLRMVEKIEALLNTDYTTIFKGPNMVEETLLTVQSPTAWNAYLFAAGFR